MALSREEAAQQVALAHPEFTYAQAEEAVGRLMSTQDRMAAEGNLKAALSNGNPWTQPAQFGPNGERLGAADPRSDAELRADLEADIKRNWGLPKSAWSK